MYVVYMSTVDLYCELLLPLLHLAFLNKYRYERQVIKRSQKAKRHKIIIMRLLTKMVKSKRPLGECKSCADSC